MSSNKKIIIEAPQLNDGRLSHFTFWQILFGCIAVLFLFVSFFAFLQIFLLFLAVTGFRYIRTSAGVECMYVDGDRFYVVKGDKVVWSANNSNIVSVDVDSFKRGHDGTSLVVFYLSNGDSWSVSYVNYEDKALKKLKTYVHSDRGCSEREANEIQQG